MIQREDTQCFWDKRTEPFRIAGNVYFIGTHYASTHIIDTGEGLILIDPGYDKSLFIVIDGIYKLGYKPADIKYIFVTHWHWDHSEATAALQAISGAKTIIGEKDRENAKRYFDADITVSDGDTLTLGNTTMTFMETPGHTRGTISFFFDTVENGKTYRVGSFGGAGINTLRSEDCYDFEGCREAYKASVERLKKEHVDIFIGNHVWNNSTFEKGKILAETGVNEFIDDKAFPAFLDKCMKNWESVVNKEK